MDAKHNNYLQETQDEGTLYTRLIRNLDQEILLQQSFLQVLDKELSVLTSASMGGIEETNDQKETLILETKSNAVTRQTILEQLKKIFGLQKDQQVTLSVCEARVSDETMSGRLKGCRQTLINLLEQVQINNQRNQEAIQAALDSVQGSLRLLKSMLFPMADYQRTGQYNQNHGQGAFISREG
jgi:flagellar biosynthesis/type III secretory pathway chaperone